MEEVEFDAGLHGRRDSLQYQQYISAADGIFADLDGFSTGADQQNGDAGIVPDLIDGAAEEKISQKTMSVRGHGDEVAVFEFSDAHNFPGRISQSKLRRGFPALRATSGRD